ncbi:MAG TPA: HEAT repeat domain-containing protein [Gammaproteobacteria bacterium]|nr:HEAT repeat domain-containing protein [Gammaproteobacteria bacterium]
MMKHANTAPPDALLLLTSRCPHCPVVLQGLGELVKKGRIGRLEAVNIEAHPEVAEQYGVRTVPWIRLGAFELEGLHTPAELEQWAQRATADDGLAQYYAELLRQGQLSRVLSAIRRHSDHLAALLALAADPDIDLTIRIGVSAVIEEYAGSPLLQEQLASLLELARHSDPRVRADAAHFLALSGNEAARAALETLVQDPEPAVREVAVDSLEALQASLREAD